MAVDAFLKLDGIVGEHKGEVPLESFSWGVSNSATFCGGGGGAGRVSFQDFSFTSKVRLQSPRLFLPCAEGQHIKKAILSCRTVRDEQVEITFSNVLISSYKEDLSILHKVDEANVPLEFVSLNFAKMEVRVGGDLTGFDIICRGT